MTDDDPDDPDDEISQIVAFGSEYERLRLLGGIFSGQSLGRKIRLHALLLVALSLIYPIALLLPPAVRPLFPGPRPPLGSPNIVILGLFGALTQVFAGTLMLVIARRLTARDLERVDAQRYVALESVASALGFGTGGIAIGLTLGFFLLNLGGVGTARPLRAALASARGPYVPSGVGMSVRSLAVAALLAGLVLLAASRTVDGID
jgi:hypothetical protein